MQRTEIYINNTLVDIFHDYDMSLNYAIADIKTPEKRDTSYSKTIELPGSKGNNDLFTYIYEISKESLTSGNGINFDPDFNPNKKADIKIYADGLLQFTGYVQLKKIKRLVNEIVYEVVAFGVLANLLADVEGKKLTDLDFSEYDHDLTKQNQRDSWDTNIQKDGADYVNFSGGAPIGEGYVYPIIDYGYRQSLQEYEVEKLFPAVYLKTYIDKIFEYAGFTYTSSFFTSEFFKRIIIPFSGEVIKISNADRDSRKFSSQYNADDITTNAGGNLSNYFMTFPNETLDPSGVFDLLTFGTNTYGVYTVNKNGFYDVAVDLDCEVYGATNPIPNNLPQNYLQIVMYVFEPGGFNTNVIRTDVVGPYQSRNDILFNDTVKIPNVELKKGSTVRVEILYTNTLKVKSGTRFYNNPVFNPLKEGDPLQMNGAIPREILMRDFFMWIVRKYNLMVNPDPDNDKNLLIEPAVDFYAGNSVVDWTSKLDTSKSIEVLPVSEIDGKEYVFSYKEDGDFYNSDYLDKYQVVYGTKKISIDNDFVKGTKTLDIGFAATPSVGNIFNDMVVPRIVKLRDDGSGAVDPFSGKIRILYYGGLKSANGDWKYISKINTSETPLPGAAGYYYTSESDYPYAGHLDDPYNPTIDLLFDIPEEIYWGSATNIGTTYTNNNIYNKYHKQFIEEITDKDSKIIVAYFRLRPLDIFKLNFKNFIHVNGLNYRLNKISDYNPIRENICKVELAKIKRGVPFTPTVIGIDGTQSNPRNFSIIEGGLDEVRDAAATSPWHLIDGGLDEVRDPGATTTIHIINGGKD